MSAQGPITIHDPNLFTWGRREATRYVEHLIRSAENAAIQNPQSVPAAHARNVAMSILKHCLEEKETVRIYQNAHTRTLEPYSIKVSHALGRTVTIADFYNALGFVISTTENRVAVATSLDRYYADLLLKFAKLSTILFKKVFCNDGGWATTKLPVMACIMWSNVGNSSIIRLQIPSAESTAYTLTTSIPPTGRPGLASVRRTMKTHLRDDLVAAFSNLRVVEPPAKVAPNYGHCAEHPAWTTIASNNGEVIKGLVVRMAVVAQMRNIGSNSWPERLFEPACGLCMMIAQQAPINYLDLAHEYHRGDFSTAGHHASAKEEGTSVSQHTSASALFQYTPQSAAAHATPAEASSGTTHTSTHVSGSVQRSTPAASPAFSSTRQNAAVPLDLPGDLPHATQPGTSGHKDNSRNNTLANNVQTSTTAISNNQQSASGSSTSISRTSANWLGTVTQSRQNATTSGGSRQHPSTPSAAAGFQTNRTTYHSVPTTPLNASSESYRSVGSNSAGQPTAYTAYNSGEAPALSIRLEKYPTGTCSSTVNTTALGRSYSGGQNAVTREGQEQRANTVSAGAVNPTTRHGGQTVTSCAIPGQYAGTYVASSDTDYPAAHMAHNGGRSAISDMSSMQHHLATQVPTSAILPPNTTAQSDRSARSTRGGRYSSTSGQYPASDSRSMPTNTRHASGFNPVASTRALPGQVQYSANNTASAQHSSTMNPIEYTVSGSAQHAASVASFRQSTGHPRVPRNIPPAYSYVAASGGSARVVRPAPALVSSGQYRDAILTPGNISANYSSSTARASMGSHPLSSNSAQQGTPTTSSSNQAHHLTSSSRPMYKPLSTAVMTSVQQHHADSGTFPYCTGADPSSSNRGSRNTGAGSATGYSGSGHWHA